MKVTTCSLALVTLLSYIALALSQTPRENTICHWSNWRVGNCSAECGIPTAVRTRNCLCPNNETTPDCEGAQNETVYCLTQCTRTATFWRYHHSRSNRTHFQNPWPISESTKFGCELGPNQNKSSLPWLAILNVPPGNDKWGRVAIQYITARLNLVMGAPSNPDIQEALSDAEYLLQICDNSYITAQLQILDNVYRFLASFNNGDVLSPRCTDKPCCYLEENDCKCPGYEGLYSSLDPFCEPENTTAQPQAHDMPESLIPETHDNETTVDEGVEPHDQPQADYHPVDQINNTNNDCYWGEWEEFSNCSADCGGGEKSRVKHCYCLNNGEEPQNTSLCQGVQPKEEIPCNIEDCSGAKPPSFWATHNKLATGDNHHPWPIDAETLTFSCENSTKTSETWLNILLSTKADLWTSMAQQYITATLNKEINATMEEKVTKAYQKAETFLKNCNGYTEDESKKVNQITSILKSFNLGLQITEELTEDHDTLNQGSTPSPKDSMPVSFNDGKEPTEVDQSASSTWSTLSQDIINLVSTFYVIIPVAIILVISVTITVTVLIMRRIYRGTLYEIPDVPDDELDEHIELGHVTLDDDDIED